MQRFARFRELVVKETHRALWYEDGVLKDVRGAGRYRISLVQAATGRPQIEVVLVDVRQRELTIKGQEILTCDKVAIRVSIIVQFRVTDARAAVHEVENYEERLYSDVQLAARRSLASMTLEEILTNRNRLNEEILQEVKETAARYGVAILRADVKDLMFPGNLQEIMNRVLGAERLREVSMVEARTKADIQRIEAETKAEARRLDTEAAVASARRLAESDADNRRLAAEAERDARQEAAKSAEAFRANPALLRLEELKALRELAANANARIYIGFDKHKDREGDAG